MRGRKKWNHMCANVTSRPKLIVSWTKAGRVHGTIEPAALSYIWCPFGDNRRFQASKFSLVTYSRFVFNEFIQTVVLNVNKFSKKPDAKGKENLEMTSLSLSFKISQLWPENSCNLVLSCQITVTYFADNICYKKKGRYPLLYPTVRILNFQRWLPPYVRNSILESHVESPM